MSKIIYTTETGIAIIHPTGELSIDQVFQKDVPEQYKPTAYIVEDEVIPADRTYRNAWEHIALQTIGEVGIKHSISENLDKAKEIHKEKLRAERKPLLEEQDVLFIKALETNSDTKKILEEKQRLRDITELVDKCDNTIELRKISCSTGKINADN